MLVFGAGGHARVVIDALEQCGIGIAGVYDDNPSLQGQSCVGHLVVGQRAELLSRPDNLPAVVAIAKNQLRWEVVRDLGAAALRFRGFKYPTAVVSPHAKISETAQLLAGAIVNPGASIGEHVVLNTGCIVEHDTRVGAFAHVGPRAVLGGAVEVGEGALVGTGATVLPFIRIGAWATVGAGAVVVRNVPDRATVVGVPASTLHRQAPVTGERAPVIPLARPVLGSAEQAAVRDVLASGWLSQGPKVIEFEKALSEYLGCQYVRAANSGTSALLLALKAVGVGSGDSVVVPAFTCAASALPVLAVGAKPVFADIDLATFNTTWHQAERVLRPDTKAVILAYLFGRMADAPMFAEQCRVRGIALIEDAALALGAKRAGRCAGTFGSAGCFSFHPRKMITTGEGGAVCTDDPDLAAQVRSDSNYGASVSAWDRFQENVGRLRGFQRVAFNMKMTDIQAAMGTVQLARLSEFIAARRRIAARYRDAFSGIPMFRLPAPSNDAEEDVCQAFVCIWTPKPLESLLADPRLLERATEAAERFKSDVAAQGIAVSDAAQFLPELPVFRAEIAGVDAAAAYPNALVAAKLAFALPIFPGMTDEQIDRVIHAVRAAAQAVPS